MEIPDGVIARAIIDVYGNDTRIDTQVIGDAHAMANATLNGEGLPKPCLSTAVARMVHTFRTYRGYPEEQQKIVDEAEQALRKVMTAFEIDPETPAEGELCKDTAK